jgi:hypothetical protein
MLLRTADFSPAERFASGTGILFQMGWLIPLVRWKIDEFPDLRFRKGAEIVGMVGLGSAFLGACIGAPFGIIQTGDELVDLLGFAVIFGFYGAAIGLLTGGILAVLYVGFFRLVAGPLVTRLPQSVAGLLTGLLVGGFLPSILILSHPYLRLPSGKEAIVQLILLPAVICAAYGSLAARVGHH